MAKQTLLNQWRTKKQEKKVKLDPLPTPLRSGKLISYSDFCKSNITQQTKDAGKPKIIDQWFSISFSYNTFGDLNISWLWTSSRHVILPFHYISSDDIHEDDVNNIVKGIYSISFVYFGIFVYFIYFKDDDDICNLLEVMDYFDNDFDIYDRTTKKPAYNIYDTTITLTDQANDRKHLVSLQSNLNISSKLLLLSPTLFDSNSRLVII